MNFSGVSNQAFAQQAARPTVPSMETPRFGCAAHASAGALSGPATDRVDIRFGQKGASSVDKRLMQAVADNELIDVQSALFDGADINARDKDGLPVISQAIRRSALTPGASMDLISFLLQDRITLEGPGGKPVLDGADANKADKAGFTPLMHAVIADFADPNEQASVINTLLAAGADPTVPVPGFDGRATSLSELAKDFGNDTLAKRLEAEAIVYQPGSELPGLAENFSGDGRKIKERDDILLPRLGESLAGEVDEQGRGLLTRLVAQDYYRDALLEFLDTEAELLKDQPERGPALSEMVNQQDRHRETALMLAAANGDAEVAKKLLALEADPTLENHQRKTAGDLAEVGGHQALARQLREKEIDFKLKRLRP